MVVSRKETTGSKRNPPQNAVLFCVVYGKGPSSCLVITWDKLYSGLFRMSSGQSKLTNEDPFRGLLCPDCIVVLAFVLGDRSDRRNARRVSQALMWTL